MSEISEAVRYCPVAAVTPGNLQPCRRACPHFDRAIQPDSEQGQLVEEMAATQETLEAMRAMGVLRNALDEATAAFAAELRLSMVETRPFCHRARLIEGTGDVQEL